MKKTQYIIYALQDPLTLEIRYIGKSVSGLNRPRQHIQPSRLNHLKTHKANWIRSLVNNGLKPIVKVVQYLNNPFELNDAETYWIAYFKTQGCPLTNITLGGGGTTGCIPVNKGKKMSIESCKKMSLAKLGKSSLRKSSIIDSNQTVYSSIVEAAQILNINRTGILQVLSGKIGTFKGLSFKYLNKQSKTYTYKKQKHIQDQNGTIYKSIREASRQTGIDNRKIIRLIENNKLCEGYKFQEINHGH